MAAKKRPTGRPVDWSKDNVTIEMKASEIRRRLLKLFKMGDAAVFYECWRDTDERLIENYSWTLDVANI